MDIAFAKKLDDFVFHQKLCDFLNHCLNGNFPEKNDTVLYMFLIEQKNDPGKDFFATSINGFHSLTIFKNRIEIIKSLKFLKENGFIDYKLGPEVIPGNERKLVIRVFDKNNHSWISCQKKN